MRIKHSKPAAQQILQQKRARAVSMRAVNSGSNSKLTSRTKLKNSIAHILSIKSGEKIQSESISTRRLINETELFAAAVHSHFSRESNPNQLNKFERLLADEVNIMSDRGREIKFFNATKRTLRKMVKSKDLAHAEYKEIKAKAFGKAQLDSNRTNLSTMRSEEAKSSDTPVRTIDTALTKFESNQGASDLEIKIFRKNRYENRRELLLERARRNRLSFKESSVNQSTTQSVSAPAGFVWKPASESDGRLVILLPSELTGKAIDVSIISPNGKDLIATGRFSGVANGFRQHYRFDSSGGAFPDGSKVLVQLNNGTNFTVSISETSQRVG